MTDDFQSIEHALRRLFDAQDYQAVATLALREYGPEILGVLASRLASLQDAREVFSDFSEDLWRGLPRFRWECSLRVWAHTLSRHAALRFRRGAQRLGRRQLPLSEANLEVARAAEKVRSTTLAHLRSEVKTRMRELREGLPIEDQELLIYRIDKAMTFRDVARIMSDPDERQVDAMLERVAARLRKRFQLAKDKLRALAEQEGLL